LISVAAAATCKTFRNRDETRGILPPPDSKLRNLKLWNSRSPATMSGGAKGAKNGDLPTLCLRL
jgi:hypothetical protein